MTDDAPQSELPPTGWEGGPPRGLGEDIAAAVVGLVAVCLALAAAAVHVLRTPLPTGWFGKPGRWTDNPLAAFTGKSGAVDLVPLLVSAAALLIIALLAARLQRLPLAKFLAGFPFVFILATVAYVLTEQSLSDRLSIEYAIWALSIGLILANLNLVPGWAKTAIRGEMYIKLGLVFLGTEILFGRLVELGLPGLMVSWFVTPIVLVSTFLFGQRVLKIRSRSLNLVVSADMSVCGVTAAIVTGAACKAKKEEISIAISLSLIFTVVMMYVMPLAIEALGVDEIVGGAWIGGTIDATGAVAAAGAALGEEAEKTAVTIKMIQNILIGFVALCVSIYCARYPEDVSRRVGTDELRNEDGRNSDEFRYGEADQRRPGTLAVLWQNFPKIVIAFLAASVLVSVLAATANGRAVVDQCVSQYTKPLRGWFFCLAFVSLGLDTRFKQLLPYLGNSRPLILYVCGQCLNILLTGLMAYLMFGVLFPPGK